MENILFKNDKFNWYDLENPDDETKIEISQRFSLNKLLIDDAFESGHLPKFEQYENLNFFIIRFFSKSEDSYTNIIREFSHKIAIYAGADFVLTIHKHPVPFLRKITEELTQREKFSPQEIQDLIIRIFKETTYSFFNSSEKISEAINYYEEFLFEENIEKVELKKLYKLKRESSACSKILLLNREALNEFKPHLRTNSELKDIIEHNSLLLQLHNQNTDDLKNLFELTTSISDMRANRVMKVLTIFAAFFLPLSFIAGVYGMNFNICPKQNINGRILSFSA